MIVHQTDLEQVEREAPRQFPNLVPDPDLAVRIVGLRDRIRPAQIGLVHTADETVIDADLVGRYRPAAW